MAVEAGAVPVLLGCLASSGHSDDEFVQSGAAKGLAVLAAALSHGSPVCSRQLPEPQLVVLRPVMAALAGLLRSTQLPAVAAEMLIALGNMALADAALAAEAAAAGAAQLATQWSLRPGAPAEVVQAAEGLLAKLAFQGEAVPAGVAAVTPQPLSCSYTGSAAGQGGSQAACCAACGATSRPDGKALQMCSACRGVSYCSGACQKRHWSKHKEGCRRRE
jgi:hypothetical protein